MALQAVDAAILLTPDDEDANGRASLLARKASVYFRMGEKAKAVEFQTMALETAPGGFKEYYEANLAKYSEP